MSHDVAQLKGLDLQRAQAAITGLDFVLQRITIRLNTGLGEWPIDPTKGLPLTTVFVERPFPRARVTALIVAEIAGTPGVGSVVDVVDSFDVETGVYRLQVAIIADEESEAVTLAVEQLGPGGNGVPWAVFIA